MLRRIRTLLGDRCVDRDLAVERTVEPWPDGEEGDLLVSGDYTVSELLDDSLIVKITDHGGANAFTMRPPNVPVAWSTVFTRAPADNTYRTRFRGHGGIQGKLPRGGHAEFDVVFNAAERTLSFFDERHVEVNAWEKKDGSPGVAGTYYDYNHARDVYPGTTISRKWTP